MGKAIDITGQKFGRLMAIRFIRSVRYSDKNYTIYWLFKCNCGKEKIINKDNVVRYLTKSCGCLQKEIISKISTKHNLSTNKIYYIWQALNSRCYRKKDPRYKNYGARGIKVLWKDFESFYKDMGKSYLEHSVKYGGRNTNIDRKNNDGPYSKGNCHWVTSSENNRNRTSNRMVTYNGLTLCIASWADKLGITQDILGQRINRYDWSIERALTQPVRFSSKRT